jgi:hypothetical protein
MGSLNRCRLLGLFLTLPPRWNDHLKKAVVLKGTSKPLKMSFYTDASFEAFMEVMFQVEVFWVHDVTTQKTKTRNLLDCMVCVYINYISTGIHRAYYVVILCDETSDVAPKQQLVLTFGYILPSGDVVKRFWSFSNKTGSKEIHMSETALEQTRDIYEKCPENLSVQYADDVSEMKQRCPGHYNATICKGTLPLLLLSSSSSSSSSLSQFNNATSN